MIGTIAPLVKGGGRRNYLPALAFGGASLLGGAVLATAARLLRLALTALGLSMPDPQIGIALVALAPLLAFVWYYGARRPLPMRDRQVPREWRTRLGPERVAPLYGFVLGSAVATRINSPVVYALPLAALFANLWWLAISPAIAFAGARAAIVIWRSTYRPAVKHDPSATARWATLQFFAWTGGAFLVSLSAVSAALVVLIANQI